MRRPQDTGRPPGPTRARALVHVAIEECEVPLLLEMLAEGVKHNVGHRLTQGRASSELFQKIEAQLPPAFVGVDLARGPSRSALRILNHGHRYSVREIPDGGWRVWDDVEDVPVEGEFPCQDSAQDEARALNEVWSPACP